MCVCAGSLSVGWKPCREVCKINIVTTDEESAGQTSTERGREIRTEDDAHQDGRGKCTQPQQQGKPRATWCLVQVTVDHRAVCLGGHTRMSTDTAGDDRDTVRRGPRWRPQSGEDMLGRVRETVAALPNDVIINIADRAS